MPKKKKSIYPLWVLIPALLIYTVFSVVPIVISLVCSFTDWNMGRLYTPAFNGVANYIELLKDPVFLRSIGNFPVMSSKPAQQNSKNKLMFNFEESPLKLIIHFGLPMILLCKLLQIIKLLMHSADFRNITMKKTILLKIQMLIIL